MEIVFDKGFWDEWKNTEYLVRFIQPRTSRHQKGSGWETFGWNGIFGVREVTEVSLARSRQSGRDDDDGSKRSYEMEEGHLARRSLIVLPNFPQKTTYFRQISWHQVESCRSEDKMRKK